MVNEQPGMDQAQSARPTPSSARLQILSTEHWSLLATRSLTYTESFSRVGMFLTVLTGAVVALALLAQVGHFNRPFTMAALLILSVVFFVGLATIGRLRALNRDDVQWVAGMNRLRRAYLEIDPDLEPYFITSSHDDMPGVMSTMAMGPLPQRPTLGAVAHGLSTLPGVMGVVVSVVAGVLGSLVVAAVTADAPEEIAILVGVVVFLTTLVALSALSQRGFFAFAQAIPARFPSPPPVSRA